MRLETLIWDDGLKHIVIELPARLYHLTVVRKQLSIPKFDIIPIVTDFGTYDEGLIISFDPRFLSSEEQTKIKKLVRQNYGPVKVSDTEIGSFGWLKVQKFTSQRFPFRVLWYLSLKHSDAIIEDVIIEVKYGDWFVTQKGYHVRLLGIEAPKPFGSELDYETDRLRWLARGYSESNVNAMIGAVKEYVAERILGQNVVIWLPIENFRNKGYIYGNVLYYDADGNLRDIGLDILSEFDIVSVWIPYKEEMDVFNEQILRSAKEVG